MAAGGRGYGWAQAADQEAAGIAAQRAVDVGIEETGPVVAGAAQGDLEQALGYGRQAIAGQRLSVPSLLMASGELATIVSDRYPADPEDPGET